MTTITLTKQYKKAFLLTRIGYFDTTRELCEVLYPQDESTDVDVVYYQNDNGVIKFVGSDDTWQEDKRGRLQPINASNSPMSFNTCDNDFATWDKLATIFSECER